MILAERGKIRLLDPAATSLASRTGSEDGKDKKVIRIADLLTQFRTPALCPARAGTEIRFSQPGRADGVHRRMQTRFQAANRLWYSCLNFITLQHIIEAVKADNPLRDFAREKR